MTRVRIPAPGIEADAVAYLLQWIGPTSDGLEWYKGHEQSAPGVRPRFFEATWVSRRANAHRFDTREEAEKVAAHWSARHVAIIEADDSAAHGAGEESEGA